MASFCEKIAREMVLDVILFHVVHFSGAFQGVQLSSVDCCTYMTVVLLMSMLHL